jgi:23S rRNA pseudouridine1911/1915/1917 synthase
MSDHKSYNNKTIQSMDYTGRLDVFLAQQFPERSRAFWQHAIESGFVVVNDAVQNITKHKVRVDDEVSIAIPEQVQDDIEVPIIFENENVIVINKPAGVLVHNKSHWLPEPSIATHFADKLDFENPHIRMGIVHRLDRDTSGVMILAKNDQTLSYLQRQFQDRTTDKKYCAIVVGKPEKDEAVIDIAIERNMAKPTTFKPGRDGKPSFTKYKVVESNDSYSRLFLWPKTGRTHQLRVHLKAIGHPIVGDVIYGTQDKRLFLHAVSLQIEVPGMGRQTFEADVPAEFVELMNEV